MTPRTLIADDQPHVLEALRLLLKSEGYQIEAANSPKGVLDRLATQKFDLLLMDLNYALDTTSGQEGLDLLSSVQKLDSRLPVVVMTAWGSIPLAVEAMRRGARDFVEKPWENSDLLSTLRQQIEARRMEEGQTLSAAGELAEALATQRGLLPRQIPEVAGCEVAVTWEPASGVGGDYLDVAQASDGKLALVVGDVIGKGVPAALLMANLQAAVRLLTDESLPPAEVAARVNGLVKENVEPGKFITFFYGILDETRRRFTYTNAGHNAPVLVRQSGEVLRLEEGGAVLGVFAQWHYLQGEVQVGPGDRLVLFTDGVTEAENAAGEAFGEARLLEVLRANRGCSAQALRDRVVETVKRFASQPFEDDVTGWWQPSDPLLAWSSAVFAP